jgi:hypothetical protein
MRRASVACSPIKENYTPLRENIGRADKLAQSENYNSFISDGDKIIVEEN